MSGRARWRAVLAMMLTEQISIHAQTADMVCAPTLGCAIGKTSSKAGVTLTNTQSTNSSIPRSALLLPGTYSSSSVILSNSTQLASLLGNASSTPTSYTGFTLSSTSTTASVQQLPGLIVYASSLYSDASSLLPFNDSTATKADSSFTPLSILLSPNLYAVASIPVAGGSKQRVALWASSPDVTEWPIQLANGPWSIVDLQSSLCSPPCATGGVCGLQNQCKCKDGFAGSTCDQCLPGRYGPSCSACSVCQNGSCEQGVTGSGRCVPNVALPAAQACNCTNGVCASPNGQCLCAPGWADSPGGSKCSTCAPGFYKSGNDCLACGPGCVSCSTNTGTCQTCESGLQVSNDNSQACVAARFLPNNGTSFTTCADGTYRDGTSCVACASPCKTCYGSSTTQCLSCNTGRGLLEGSCASIDAATGICDGSGVTSESPISFVYDNEKQVCDVLPFGCTAGSISSFSISSRRTDLRCSKCLNGLVLVDGVCAAECPKGTFANNGVCSACSASCSACSGSADFCTACFAGQVLAAGNCLAGSTCPSGFWQANSTSSCSACHPDCASCSGAYNQCSSCKPDRPALTAAKTCVPTCPAAQYLDTQSATCRPCDSSCSTCIGAGSGQCLSCPASYLLKAGQCVTAQCDTINGLGICLKSLVSENTKSSLNAQQSARKLPGWAYAVLVIGILLLVALLVLLWRMRAVNKRLKKTQGFQQKRGLFGFLRQNKKIQAELKEPTLALHNHIELVGNQTPPPSYVHPAFRPYGVPTSWLAPPTGAMVSDKKASLLSSASSQASNGKGHSTINWPQPAESDIDEGETLSFRSFLRPSNISISHSQDSERRYGHAAFPDLTSNEERQRALNRLIGR